MPSGYAHRFPFEWLFDFVLYLSRTTLLLAFFTCKINYLNLPSPTNLGQDEMNQDQQESGMILRRHRILLKPVARPVLQGWQNCPGGMTWYKI